MEKTKKCKVCGSDSWVCEKLHTSYGNSNGEFAVKDCIVYGVRCYNMGCQNSAKTTYCKDKNEAINAWNNDSEPKDADVIKIYNMKELQKVLKSSRQTIATEIKDGKLKAFKVGRSWRVTEQSLGEYMEETKNG